MDALCLHAALESYRHFVTFHVSCSLIPEDGNKANLRNVPYLRYTDSKSAHRHFFLVNGTCIARECLLVLYILVYARSLNIRQAVKGQNGERSLPEGTAERLVEGDGTSLAGHYCVCISVLKK
jgi:hypothetical protein